MNRKRITLITALAALSFGCLTPSAFAETKKDTTHTNPSTITTVSENASVDVLNPQNAIDAITTNAQLIIVESSGTKKIQIEGSGKLNNIAKEYNLNLKNYNNADGTKLDKEYKLKSNEKYIIFRSEITAKAGKVELPIPTVKKKTDDLYVGEKKVESKGKVGEALKTTVSVKDLSADKKVNKKAVSTKSELKDSVKDSFTVITAPEPKIILVGTKEKPVYKEPVQEETVDLDENVIAEKTDEPQTTENSTSDTSDHETERTYDDSASDNNTSSLSENRTKVASTLSLQSSKSDSNEDSANDSIEIGDKAVRLAETRLGSPYVWASAGPNSFDCSGLINWIYKDQLGYDIPRTANQIGHSVTEIDLDDMQPGDVLWDSGHIGLYIGNGQMIHASGSQKKVVVSSIDWFVDRGAHAGRIQ